MVEKLATSYKDPRALCSLVHNVLKVIERAPAFHPSRRKFAGGGLGGRRKQGRFLSRAGDRQTAPVARQSEIDVAL